MQLAVIDPPSDTRLEHEVDLRRRGYVPVTAPGALFRAYEGLLPSCSVRQVLPEPRQSRLVWSHPGRSGIDPRAVAPLAIVRVADGLGPDPLEEALTLCQAATWLLDGDVTPWLVRPRHRLVLGTCLLEREDHITCRTHPVADALLQQVATALGDRSLHCCRLGKGTAVTDYAWQGAVEDLPDLLWSASWVTARLGGWYRSGVTGATAWDLARHGSRAELADEWVRAGFTLEQAALWSGCGHPQACADLRSRGHQPIGLVAPVPLPVVKARGLSGFDRWNYAKRKWAFAPCPWCGASAPAGKRCRTCESTRRTTPLRSTDWALYQRLDELGPAYAPPGLTATRALCGAGECQTPLALSVVDEGAQQ